ncbi:MAG: ParB/RepB/Spo0J family partition protein [Gracilibacteraceae bacterium]|jgi:ParB family chromosome partitioning protein|nr:ParB/RepB/Spo0J family partition protein [Gracilibacteraceae bacterium]
MPERTGDEIREIPLAEIQFNPEQPRQDFDPQKIQELADSIRSVGLVQPILVRPLEEGYRIIAGERRYRACQALNYHSIKCIIVHCDEREMSEMAIVENVQRADLHPVEEGAAYARLIEQYGLTQEQVAQRVGKARSTVTNLLRIIQLPVSVLTLLNAGDLTPGHAKALLALPEQAAQEELAPRIVAEGWSVRKTEEYIAQLRWEEETAETDSASPRTGRNSRSPKPRSTVTLLEEELQKSLQTRVFIKGNESKGKIEIFYYSPDELNRLLDLWQVEIG